MMISTKGRYALNVMIDLSHYDEGELISLKEVSNRLGISMKYLENIVGTLQKGGLLHSARGKKGGYCLTKRPEEYTIGEILKQTEKSLAPVTCLEGGKVNCENAPMCITLPLWQKLDGIIDQYLESVTLKDLIDGNV